MSSPSISVMNCGRALSFASHLAPVVVGRPIVREFLHRRELNALRCVGDRLPFRPLRGGDAPAKLGELLLREAEGEGADRIACGRCAQRPGKHADGRRLQPRRQVVRAVWVIGILLT